MVNLYWSDNFPFSKNFLHGPLNFKGAIYRCGNRVSDFLKCVIDRWDTKIASDTRASMNG